MKLHSYKKFIDNLHLSKNHEEQSTKLHKQQSEYLHKLVLSSVESNALTVLNNIKHVIKNDNIMNDLLASYLNSKGILDRTILITACVTKKYQLVEWLVDNVPDIDLNAQDKKNYSAVSLMYKQDRLDLLKLLVKKGADINVKNKEGVALLMEACGGCELDKVKFLVENGADVNIKNKHNCTPFMLACQRGYIDIVKFLAENDASIDDTDSNGNNALIRICKKERDLSCNYKILSFLLDNGINVNARNNQGESGLMLACEQGSIKIAKFLVQNDANVDITDNNGNTALARICKYQKFVYCNQISLSNLANSLDQDQDQDQGHDTVSMIICAAESGRMDIVELLVKKGADTNVADQNGSTILINACEGGWIDIVKFLVNNGANVHATDNNGNNALMRIFRKHNNQPLNKKIFFEIVQFLIEKGVNVNDKNIVGISPLMHACSMDDLNVIEFLLNKDANINDKDKSGNTPFMRACERGNLNILEFLIKNGADINAKNEMGISALFNVCATMGIYTPIEKRLSILEFLLNNGANINIQTNHGFTPLAAAYHHDELKIAEFLIKNGADTTIQISGDWDVLMFACSDNKHKMIQLFIDLDVIGNNSNMLLWGTQYECESVVKFLLQKEINVNMRGEHNDTALIYASKTGNAKIVKLLLSHKDIDVDAVNDCGGTALMYACSNGDIKVVKSLLDSKASINIKKDGCNAFTYAVKKYIADKHNPEKTEILKLLIKSKADYSLTYQAEDSALITLSKNHADDLIKLILDKFSGKITHDDCEKLCEIYQDDASILCLLSKLLLNFLKTKEVDKAKDLDEVQAFISDSKKPSLSNDIEYKHHTVIQKQELKYLYSNDEHNNNIGEISDISNSINAPE